MLSLLAFFACSDEDGTNVPNPPSGNGSFATNIPFVRLQNDSTKTAGTLEITAPTSEVNLEWNVKPGFNIDTTVTSLKVLNGRATLPIKWDKPVKDSIFAPTNMAFSGGLRITAGDYSKYVPIVWADEIDSVYYSQTSEIMTRADEGVMPAAVGLEIHPSETIYMEYGNDSSNPIEVTIESEFETGSYEKKDLEKNKDRTHIDVDAITGSIVDFAGAFNLQWNNLGAPVGTEFAEHLLVKSGRFNKYIHFMYDGSMPDFQYVSCSPLDGGILPATNAVVAVKATTNREWSIESDTLTVNGDKSPLGLKTLAINIGENIGKGTRSITVLVKCEGELKKTLTFTQKGRENGFTVNTVSPDAPGPLLASGADININVTTDDTEWWTEVNGIRTTHQAIDTDVICKVTPNPGTAERDVTVLIGYGNVIARQLVYRQLAGSSLTFDKIEPSGNIPVEGASVKLYFTGEYQGNVTVRAYLQSDPGTPIAESVPTTNKIAVLNIPNNFSSLSERNIIFKYQKESDPSTNWEPIAEATKAQDPATIKVAITPAGTIPGVGKRMECLFSGTYSEEFEFRFMTENNVHDSTTGKVGSVSYLDIPKNDMTRVRQVSFDYYYNGTWISLEVRDQALDPTIKTEKPLAGEFGDQVEQEVDVEL